VRAIALITVAMLSLVACSASPEPGTGGSAPSVTPVNVDPPPEVRFVSIDTLTINASRDVAHVTFVGGKDFSPTDPCSIEYGATARIDGADLRVGVFETRNRMSMLPPNFACTLEGHFRFLDIALPQRFEGSTWHDLAGYTHFMTAPPGLVELDLPDGWRLVEERDVEQSPAGRWARTYSRSDSTRGPDTLVLFQSFGGQPVGVSGGEEITRPTVNGESAWLYRQVENGELVLVWQIGESGLALVAFESTVSEQELIRIAETAH
jgi:hypothetical protein